MTTRGRGWTAAAAGAVGLEVYLHQAYRAFDTLFHYLLHGLVGAAAGLVVLVALRLLGRGCRVPLWAGALLGRLVSAVPDVLFVAVDAPHERWMDVFVAHIAVHVVPRPLTWAFALFALAVGAAAAVILGGQRLAAGCAALALTLGVAGLAVREPIPSTLEGLRALPGYACVLPSPTPEVAASRAIVSRRSELPGVTLRVTGADAERRTGPGPGGT